MAVLPKRNSALRSLTAAALALPGVALHAETNPEGGAGYSTYDEGGRRVHAEIYDARASALLGERTTVDVRFKAETWGGASPVTYLPRSSALILSSATGRIRLIAGGRNPITDPTPTRVVSAASTLETRKQADMQLKHDFDTATIDGGVSYSTERDYESISGKVQLRWDVNQKRTSLLFGAGYGDDLISPKHDTQWVLASARPPKGFEDDKTSWLAQAGITHIVNKQALVQSTVSYTEDRGFLSIGYKKAYIQGIGVIYDSKPRERTQWAWSTQWVQHFDGSDAALHLEYRLYRDSWDIHSHAIEAAWSQPFGVGWLVEPSLRYYSQDHAYFYSVYYLEPRADGHYSTDDRMAAFGSYGAGMTVKKIFANQFSMEVGAEYYSRHKRFGFYDDDSELVANVGLDSAFFSLNLELKF